MSLIDAIFTPEQVRRAVAFLATADTKAYNARIRLRTAERAFQDCKFHLEEAQHAVETAHAEAAEARRQATALGITNSEFWGSAELAVAQLQLQGRVVVGGHESEAAHRPELASDGSPSSSSPQ
jgi:hypothetical protein